MSQDPPKGFETVEAINTPFSSKNPKVDIYLDGRMIVTLSDDSEHTIGISLEEIKELRIGSKLERKLDQGAITVRRSVVSLSKTTKIEALVIQIPRGVLQVSYKIAISWVEFKDALGKLG